MNVRPPVSALALLLSATLGPGGVTAQQPDATVRLLAELVNADGASGFEGPVRDILRREWAPLVTDLRTDGMGTCWGVSSGRPRHHACW